MVRVYRRDLVGYYDTGGYDEDGNLKDVAWYAERAYGTSPPTVEERSWEGGTIFMGHDTAHDYGEETTIIRIGCCFNEFLRKMTSDNKVTPDMIKFLRKMNVETQHFVENCLVRNLSVDAAILDQIFDKEDEDQTAEELNQTFHTV